jgi:hypothetical protein
MHEKDERVKQLPEESGQKKLGESGSLRSLIFLDLFRPKLTSALYSEFGHF